VAGLKSSTGSIGDVMSFPGLKEKLDFWKKFLGF